MKILLIYPYCLDERVQAEDVRSVPLGLYYVGAMLRQEGYDAEILNWHDRKGNPEAMRETFEEKRPDVIGFSILHANRWGGIEIARIAREVDPHVRIVFGGVGATFLWEHLLTHFNEIDFIVLGEGEYPFLGLVKCLGGDLDSIEGIAGIAFRKENKVTRTAEAPYIRDLDSLPDPAKYFEFQHVSSTRGCPSNCSFCGSPRFWGRRVRFHSSEYFVGQLERLRRKGVRFFYFSDDTFTLKKDRVIEICKEIVARDLGITWVAISRVDYVNDEMLYWMRRAGCSQISYGVESGSEKIRNRILRKNIKTGQIKRAFSLTTRYGILARAYFIYGSPGETRQTIRETLDLIRVIRPLGIIFYILDIFPGTELYSDFRRRTGLTDDVWLKRIEDIMYFETDPQLSSEQVLAFGEMLRQEYHRLLPEFADSVELEKREDLFGLHSDFLSRLGMTFSHGDYAGIESIKGKDGVAERLFRRALEYAPDHRAYLGLGILMQKRGDYKESVRILSEGSARFTESEPLHMCLGISHMNLGEHEKAVSCFWKFQDSREAAFRLAECYRAMGDEEKAQKVLEAFEPE
jgi:radical SAM superfamily enzyme YgiQ (UPF0313 family)